MQPHRCERHRQARHLPISRLCSRATLLILAAGPTRVALMRSMAAASTAPRSDVSSQGCTTIAFAAAARLASAMSRSYFDDRCGGLGTVNPYRCDFASDIGVCAFSSLHEACGLGSPRRRLISQIGGDREVGIGAQSAAQLKQSADALNALLIFARGLAACLQYLANQIERPLPRRLRLPATSKELPRAPLPGRAEACRIALVRSP